MTISDAEALIRLSITPGSDSPQDVADRLGDERALTIMSAALANASARKFPEGTSLADISTYAAGLKDRYPDAENILKSTVAEAVIRAARGEQDRLEGLDPNDVAPLLFLLTYAIMTEWQLSEDEKDTYVNEVLQLAGEG